MKQPRIAKSALTFLILLTVATTALAGNGHGAADLTAYEWTEVNEDAAWAPRAGLQVLKHRNSFYLMGGRTPRPPTFPPIPGDSEIWGDVWKSRDRGKSWHRILETDDADHWPARAYFRAVKKGAYMYVLGGQNFKLIPNPDPMGPPFLSASDFFSDVWRSKDGMKWHQMTADAGWQGRAGLSSVVFKGHIYVMAGSFNDDPAVIGGPPTRVYFDDVWRSRDGRHWTRLVEHAPWAPRAGAIVVVKNGYLYLLGGEDGFICLPGSRCPPYYNDVWRSRNGTDWELVTEAAAWPPRPGHQAVVLRDKIVLFGGFGLSDDPANPFAAANPMDMWVSKDGASWEQISDSPWNATSPADIKYDFAAVVARGGGGGFRQSIFTFGGDRETFDFQDPTNYLNVDNDVWRFSAPRRGGRPWGEQDTSPAPTPTQLHANAPNPFNPMTTISFDLAEPGWVSLQVHDVAGRLVRTLVEAQMPADRHSVVWDGRNDAGMRAASGVHYYRLTTGAGTQIRRMVMIK